MIQSVLDKDTEVCKKASDLKQSYRTNSCYQCMLYCDVITPFLQLPQCDNRYYYIVFHNWFERATGFTSLKNHYENCEVKSCWNSLTLRAVFFIHHSKLLIDSRKIVIFIRMSCNAHMVSFHIHNLIHIPYYPTNTGMLL